jgi:NADH-quinone oxidoreductase subunit L
LIFGGPIGKSAQFPLQFWLPEAMAGPTTVSALIHAAAMVKAGIYMTVRTFPMWYLGLHDLGLSSLKTYFLFVAAIGAFTAFMSATMGTATKELKKILAFSTISQLAYMFIGLGAGGLIAPHGGEVEFYGYFAGSFHMLSHAVFKALLFLAAGAVIHTVHSKYVDDMGGLRKDMPTVFWPMVIGGLSLAGVPPLGGFFSKESIFAACWHLGEEGNAAGWIFFVVAALSAVLTIFYTIRMLAYTFSGEKSDHVKHVEEEHDGHLHKPSPILWVPLVILAAGTIVLGFLGPLVENFITHNNWFEAATTFTHEAGHINYGHFFEHTFTEPTFFITLGILLVGGLPAYFLFIRKPGLTAEIREKSKVVNGLYHFLYMRWYFNTAIYWLMKKFKQFAVLSYKHFDLKVIDGANNAIATGTMQSGEVFRKTHTGVLSINFIYMLLGAIVILAVLLFAL